MAPTPRFAPTEEDRPPRPSLPPLLLMGLSLWAAAACSYAGLQDASIGSCVSLAILGILTLLLVLGGCGLRGRLSGGAVLILGVALGMAVSGASAASLHRMETELVDQPRTWIVTLAEDARSSQFGAQAAAQARSDGGEIVKVRLYLSKSEAQLLQGTQLSLKGALKPFSSKAAASAWSKGLAGTLDGASVDPDQIRLSGMVRLRQRSLNTLAQFGGNEAPLLQALVCGYRRTLEEEGTYQVFQVTGLAHLVAVSGAHLSLVTLFVMALMGAFRLSHRTSSALLGLFLVAYVTFTGLPVSALRAALMTATALLSFIARRRSSALSALGLCLVVFVVFDVPTALSASFFLSAASTLGILLFSRLFLEGFPSEGRWPRTLIGDPLALTASSALMTQPYGAALFAQLPLVAPLANVIATPLFTLSCLGGFAGTALALLLPATAPLAIGLATLCCRPLVAATTLLAAIPLGCIPVAADLTTMVALSALGAIALWLWWPRITPKRAAVVTGVIALILVGVLVVSPLLQEDELVMLDVGQGDAFLLRSQGHSLLIDTGNQERKLKEALGRNGVVSLDAVAISHHDDDHCGSLVPLQGVVSFSNVLVAQETLSCSCSSCRTLVAVGHSDTPGRPPLSLVGLSVGDTIVCGRFQLEVIWPARFVDEGGNADSLSLLCTYDGDSDGTPEWSLLFCGDAEREELVAMADHLPTEGIDVLKVGHHGSRVSLDHGAAELLAPSLALISVGEDNRYGHPSPECLAYLESTGTQVFRSDEQGDVTVAFTAQKITVRAQREEPLDRVQ